MAMLHDMPLLSTLATGLSSAFVGGMLAARLRLSPIVGYLLAGIFIGPYTPGVEANVDMAGELAEIGIVLLMFGVGLHFSVQDLLKVRGIALPGAVGQILASIAMGAGAAALWDWPLESGLLIGFALSVASTVVLLRALEQHNILHSLNGRIAVGWLVVEDLVMVLALVLIPALAPNFTPQESLPPDGDWLSVFLLAFGKICLFLICMLVAGKRLLPLLLRLVAQTRSRELFTLSVFAAAIGVAFGAAELFGVSFALGAFFAGMMIKESDLSHEVAEKALPFQDAFAVLFFVAVGMLFDPGIIIEKPLEVLTVVFIIIFGKSLAAFLIVLLFRHPLRTALLVSASLAQIGEFSFILAALGMKLELISSEQNSLILAGALISISLNPLAFHAINGIHRYVTSSPRLVRHVNTNDDRLSQLPEQFAEHLHHHIVLVGYGHVGREIYSLVQDLPMVIIDMNRERVEELRGIGVPALVGDAATPVMLANAHIERASFLAISVRSAFEAQRIITAARLLNPKLRVLARVEKHTDMPLFTSLEVELPIWGQYEVARRIVEHLRQRHSAPLE